MLLRRAHLDGIVRGEVTLAFRRWKRPTVKAGGTLHTALGQLAIDAVDIVSGLTEAEAKKAGYASRRELLAELREGDDRSLFRVRLRFLGADPRVALRASSKLTSADIETLRARLERFDASSRRGAWTLRTLEAIRDQPATLAAELAAECGWERAWFKPNVRKLKALGLTESLEVGYRLSPRGEAFLSALRRKKA